MRSRDIPPTVRSWTARMRVARGAAKRPAISWLARLGEDDTEALIWMLRVRYIRLLAADGAGLEDRLTLTDSGAVYLAQLESAIEPS